MAFTVVYDACVLYPVRLRDLLVRAAYTPQLNLRARVTSQIIEELGRALIRTGAMPESRWVAHRAQIEAAVPDFVVNGYEILIDGIDLPDPDDRHVVAAAIRAHASAVVTFNLADFPASTLDAYGLEAVHPDDFCCSLIDQSAGACVDLIHQQREALVRPPLSVGELLERFSAMGLPLTAGRLRDELGLV